MALQPLILHAHAFGQNPPKVAIVLEALNVPYEVKLWQFGAEANGVKGSEYLKINENGRVPALEDPNTSVTAWESNACINYLLRVYDKENKLGPRDTEQDRIDFDKWTSFLLSTLAPMQGQVNRFKHFHSSKNEDALARYEEQTHQYYGVLEGHLKKHDGVFILPGSTMSSVDAHFYPWIKGAAFAGIDLDKYPSVKEFLDHMGSLEEVQAAYEKIAKGQEM